MQNSRQENKTLAPIVLFVYNRPEHTRKVVEALLICPEAKDSDLIVFSDAPRGLKDIDNVRQVRDFLDKISGFKSVKIIKRKANLGCTPNMIEGITRIMDEYGRGIIVEDDIFVAPQFLKFMNLCLNKYKDDYNIWNISGISPEFGLQTDKDVVVWGHQNCWGWATWKDRWDNFEGNREKTLSEITPEQKKAFDFGGVIPCSPQLDYYAWDIAWNWTIFKNGKLSINPVKSLVKNIGLDGTGTNYAKGAELYDPWKDYAFPEQDYWKLPDNPQCDAELVEQIINIKKRKNGIVVDYSTPTKKPLTFKLKGNLLRLHILSGYMPTIFNLKFRLFGLFTFDFALGKAKI